MKKINIHLSRMNGSIIAVAFVSLLFSCGKDDDGGEPIIPNEEEIITTLQYILVPAVGGDTATFTFRDTDGDGGFPPVITTDSLDSNATYHGTLILLNESVSPADNITGEVEGEAEDHQFFFILTGTGNGFSYADTDSNGDPIGLKTELNTGVSSGKLTIVLRHEPDKKAPGVSSGDITNAGGETDIEVEFDLNLK